MLIKPNYLQKLKEMQIINLIMYTFSNRIYTNNLPLLICKKRSNFFALSNCPLSSGTLFFSKLAMACLMSPWSWLAIAAFRASLCALCMAAIVIMESQCYSSVILLIYASVACTTPIPHIFINFVSIMHWTQWKKVLVCTKVTKHASHKAKKKITNKHISKAMK